MRFLIYDVDTNFILGEILHRVTSAPACRESATSLATHCNGHTISSQQQHCTVASEYIYWHWSVTHPCGLRLFVVHVDQLASSAPRGKYCRVSPRCWSRAFRGMALGHVGTIWQFGEPTCCGPRC